MRILRQLLIQESQGWSLSMVMPIEPLVFTIVISFEERYRQVIGCREFEELPNDLGRERI